VHFDEERALPGGAAARAAQASAPPRRRRWLLAGSVVVAGVGGLTFVGRSTLTRSVTVLAHLDVAWVPVAILAEAGSMAAFARSQRRLLRAGGGPSLHLTSLIAVTYAGNAISVSLPLAGPEFAAGFTFRELRRRGIEPAVAGWALAMSGVLSTAAFAAVLTAGAVASGSPTAATLGFGGAAVAMVPTVVVLVALRDAGVRRRLERLIVAARRVWGRAFHRDLGGAEAAFEGFLDQLAALRLPRLQYVEAFALAVGNWVADCLCLGVAVLATGTGVPWHVIFLAYGAGVAAGSLGLVPGGVGIVEAALTAALVGAGVKADHALAAVLVYRLISFWLVMASGWALMGVLLRKEHRETEREAVQRRRATDRDL
jgi:putative heme transporter